MLLLLKLKAESLFVFCWFVCRRLFSIMSYFFFFYNILLGLISCFFRILKGMALGVIFLSRIDRTCLMQGFQTWDPGTPIIYFFISITPVDSLYILDAWSHFMSPRVASRNFIVLLLSALLFTSFDCRRLHFTSFIFTAFSCFALHSTLWHCIALPCN